MQAQVAPAALHLADERPVNAAAVSQGLLTQALGVTLGPNPFAEDLGGKGQRLGHAITPSGPTVYVQSKYA